MLSPDGNGDSTMVVTVTVVDSQGAPIPGTPPGEIAVLCEGVSSIGHEIRFCASGSSSAQFYPDTPTDEFGKTTIEVSEVGGCGTVTLSAEVRGISLNGTAVANIRGPDFNGSGGVNFMDTFVYISFLSSGTGYCGNLNGDPNGEVNFFDTIKYLLYLANQVECP